MDKNRYNTNNDWEITLPFRVLEVFIFLTLSAFLIEHPHAATDFIPNTLVDFFKCLAGFGIFLYYIITAYQRIRDKQTAGAFLVVDYTIIGSGGFFLGVLVTLLLVV
jgi:hypothetical protein